MLKNFFQKNGLRVVVIFVVVLVTIISLLKYFSINLKGSKASASSATLSLIPASTTFTGQQVIEYQLIAQFTDGSASEKIDYLKATIILPNKNLELADYIDTTASSLGRIVQVDDPATANNSGMITIKLGAANPGSGPATSGPIIVAKIKLRGKTSSVPVLNGLITIDPSKIQIVNNLSVLIIPVTVNNATFSLVSGPTSTPGNPSPPPPTPTPTVTPFIPSPPPPSLPPIRTPTPTRAPSP